MPGSIAANFHEGTRSEYLAQYVFSAFGTAVPVPHPEDSGVDLHCTLGDRVGQRFLVEDYFLVQVKSTRDCIVYDGKEEVDWLLSHSYPFFICYVNKADGSISIYQTLALSFLHSKISVTSIELVLNDDGSGFRIPEEHAHCVVYLGPPVLKFRVLELSKPVWREKARGILRDWIRLDQENIDGRKTGFTLCRYPNSYKTNDQRIEALSYSGNFKDVERNPGVNYRYYDLLFKQLAQLANVAAATESKEQLVSIHSLVASIVNGGGVPDCWGVKIFVFCYNKAVEHLGIGEKFLIGRLHKIDKCRGVDKPKK